MLRFRRRHEPEPVAGPAGHERLGSAPGPQPMVAVADGDPAAACGATIALARSGEVVAGAPGAGQATRGSAQSDTSPRGPVEAPAPTVPLASGYARPVDPQLGYARPGDALLGYARPGDAPARSGYAGPTPTVPASAADAHTHVLDPTAAPLIDPGAYTEVLSRSGSPADDEAHRAPTPLVSRRVAAEIGMYAGAALVLVAVGGVTARGWGDWAMPMRAAVSILTSLGLVAGGLFARLPLSRTLGAERRRAVSALLVTGVGIGIAGVSAVLGAQGAATAAGAAAFAGVLAFVLVNAAARTALSETALLGSLAWLTWVVLPDRPARWAAVLALGVVWVLAGVRWAAGRRTAAVAGASLALAAGVGVAVGPWAWPARLGLAVVTVLGLGAFLKGRANYWLALGAAAATALAASVAGDLVSPALALLIGGLATMAVSGVALRHALRG